MADADDCNRLETELQGNSAGARGAEPFFAEYHNAVLSGTNGLTLVAQIDDVMVGFLTLQFTQVAQMQVATVVRVFVTPRARRVGIGDALIAAGKTSARDRNCARIDAIALPGDRDTKNLYERNELKARLIVASSNL